MRLNASGNFCNIPQKRPGQIQSLAASVQIFFICLWAFMLRQTDSYYSVYILCAVAGTVCCIQNTAHQESVICRSMWLLLAFSLWFSGATVLSNYGLFIVKPVVSRIISAACTFLGGTLAAWNLIVFVSARMPFPPQKRNLSPAKVFLLCFFLIEGFYLVYLLGAAYPAYFTPDVMNSIEQIVTGNYVNNNPFWYTMSIKAIAGLGYHIFGNANAAMAFYIFWQNLFMSAVFSYVLVTLYQTGVPGWAIICTGGAYMLLPYNIALSATMLKDIPFSISALLFLVSLYRIIREVGKKQHLNYLFFSIGSLIFCLMRTNGFASFFVTMLVVLFLLRKKQKRLLVILVIAILLLSWTLTNPVLEKWNVGSTDFVEGLALPFQQIARVITMGYELDPDTYALLNKVFDVEMIPEVFTHGTVDPIKTVAFREGGRAYLKENPVECITLWLKMGLEHPGEYLKAWIELTKGYWNGGYDYERYYIGGGHTGYGIIRPETLPLVPIFDSYFAFMESRILLQPLKSIGFHVWLLLGCLVLNIKHKRIETVLTIPGLIILAGLWLGTPVYAEFRYAYPVILSIPLILGVTLFEKADPEKTS